MPDASHISLRAFSPGLGFLWSILPPKVSPTLMVGVGSGSKPPHALVILPSGLRNHHQLLEGKRGWVLGKSTPPSPLRALHWAGEVQCWVSLGKEEVFPFWVQVVLSPCGTVSCSLRAAVLELTPLSLPATPVASGSLTQALLGAGVRVATSQPLLGGTGPPHASAGAQ